MTKEFFKNTFNRNNIKEYVYRNKKLIIISIIILLVSILIGFIFGDIFKDFLIEALKNIAKNASNNSSIETKNIYFNNLKVSAIIILSGLLLSIISTIIFFVNGLVIGFVIKIAGFGITLLFTLPHGIFEVPALELSLVCSFLVTKLEINLIKGILQNGKTFKEELDKSKQIINDIVLSIVIIFILLSIAALIEGFITLPLATFIMDIF